MDVTIHTVSLGFDNVYLLRGLGTILVDGGQSNRVHLLRKTLQEASIPPEEVRLIVLTHGHWDHIGSAADIQELTGAKIALHASERAWLETPLKPMPPGVTAWGKVLSRFLSAFVVPFVRIRTARVDIPLGDDPLPLQDYGIPGRVLHTPGHSPGSVSVVLDSGEAFVGDLAMNRFPLQLSPGLPVLAEDMAKVVESWHALLEAGARTVYPAHGPPFPADVIRRALA